MFEFRGDLVDVLADTQHCYPGTHSSRRVISGLHKNLKERLSSADTIAYHLVVLLTLNCNHGSCFSRNIGSIPRILFIFIIEKYIYRVKVSPNTVYFFGYKLHWLQRIGCMLYHLSLWPTINQ